MTKPDMSKRILALAGICSAAAAMPLTFTGPAVALPAIAHSLGGSPIALNWVTNAFMLTFGSSLMAAGTLADTYGRKRLFLSGLTAFLIFSVMLAFAPDILWFDILRALQGLGAAATFSSGMAALAQEFEGNARMRAFSIVGASFGVGLAFGPIASGLMAESFGWRSIFALVAVLGLIAFVLGANFLHETRDPDAAGLDWPGAASFTLALALLTYGVLLAPEQGWASLPVAALLAGAAALLVAFWRIERSVARPMLDLSLFRYPRFVGVQLLAAAPAYAFVVLLILLPVRFVGIDGMSEVQAGQMMVALSGPLLVLPVVAGMLTRWFSAAVICSGGLLISAGGLFWLSATPSSDPALLIAPLMMIGTGISLPWGLMDGLAVSVVPKERAGMATGIFSTTRVAGEGVALAVVSAVLSALIGTRLSVDGAAAAAQRLVTGDLRAAGAAIPGMTGEALAATYAQAFSSLLVLLAGVTVFTAVIVIAFLGRRPAETAEAACASPAE